MSGYTGAFLIVRSGACTVVHTASQFGRGVLVLGEEAVKLSDVVRRDIFRTLSVYLLFLPCWALCCSEFKVKVPSI